MFTIDHLGIAVKSLATAKDIYETLGLTVSPEETVEAEQVRLVMVPVGESRLELLEPTSDNSPIAKFIAKRGEGLHHVSLRVRDLAAALERLPQQSTSHQNSKQIEVIETVPLAGGTFSAQLVPQIAALLSKHGFKKEDIGAFAVVSGPGSFTGLRVGLAAIKALAEVLGKPIAAVSLLEAVSVAGQSHGRVMAA